MTTQPEALFLAGELEAPLGTVISGEVDRRAAIELRRLHAEVERERTARIAAQTQLEQTQDERNRAHITARREVAEELRRLHAVNQELLGALKKLEEAARCVQAGEWDRASIDVERREARAAIARAEGEA